MKDSAELARLEEARTAKAPWKKWGPYLSERQWGTVREDYSKDGNAWDYFSHDQARSRAYRWGEDGLAGFCDDKQLLCFSLALWNGKDPILKERLFGLTNSEGNHGEDVKEYYFYLDSTPTHSYMKYLYKYPQNAYPYDNLVSTNKTARPHRHGVRTARHRRLRRRPLLGRVRRVRQGVRRRRPDPDHRVQSRAGSSHAARAADAAVSQHLELGRHSHEAGRCGRWPARKAAAALSASHEIVGERYLYCEGDVPLLFTENETNNERIFGKPNASPYVKDAFHNYVIHGKQDAVNPERKGTKAAAHYQVTVPAGGSSDHSPAPQRCRAGQNRRSVQELSPRPWRRASSEADEFYRRHHARTADRRRGARHAAGAGRNAVDQAVLRPQRRPVAGRARRRSARQDRQSVSAIASGTTW